MVFAYFRIYVHMWDKGAMGELLFSEVFSPCFKSESVNQLEKNENINIRSLGNAEEFVYEELAEGWDSILEDDFKWDTDNPDEEKFFEATGEITIEYTSNYWGETDCDVDIDNFNKQEVTERSLLFLGILEEKHE